MKLKEHPIIFFVCWGWVMLTSFVVGDILAKKSLGLANVYMILPIIIAFAAIYQIFKEIAEENK